MPIVPFNQPYEPPWKKIEMKHLFIPWFILGVGWLAGLLIFLAQAVCKYGQYAILLLLYKIFLDAGLTVSKKRVERNEPGEDLPANTGIDMDREIEAGNDCIEIVERNEPAEEIPDNMDMDLDNEIKAGNASVQDCINIIDINGPAEDIPCDMDLDREIKALYDSIEITEQRLYYGGAIFDMWIRIYGYIDIWICNQALAQ